MSSPFDFVKSITTTKQSLYEIEEMFEKEYNAFIVNRALANSPQTVLFADIINQYQSLPKKLQYDFYMLGVPKQNKYLGWTKKDSSEINEELVKFVCEELNMSIQKAIEIIKLVGADNIEQLSSGLYGGKLNGKAKK